MKHRTPIRETLWCFCLQLLQPACRGLGIGVGFITGVGANEHKSCLYPSSVRLEVEESQLVANVGIVESVVRSRKYLCERGFLEKVDAQDL
jgi:hypothetical protein